MVLDMPVEHYDTLRAEADAATDPRRQRRALALVRLHEGWMPALLAKILGCPRPWLYELAKRYSDRGLGVLDDARCSRVPPKATAEYLAAATALLKTRPPEHGWIRSTWSCELLSLQMRQDTSVSVHPAHLSRLLRREGLAWNRTRPTVRPVDLDEAIERLRELVTIVEAIGPDEVLVCEDEVDIHHNPKMGFMWMPKGQQVEVMTPGTNRKRFLAGSVNMRTGDLVWVEAERKNSDLFIAWLQAIAAAHPDAKAIHVVLDNYGIHRSKRTMAALAELGERIRLHFLPPYNPQCNWMEQVWLHLHATVTRNHQCRTMEDLMERVRTFMRVASPFPGSQSGIARLAS